jgi:hypothetical protein
MAPVHLLETQRPQKQCGTADIQQDFRHQWVSLTTPRNANREQRVPNCQGNAQKTQFATLSRLREASTITGFESTGFIPCQSTNQ